MFFEFFIVLLQISANLEVAFFQRKMVFTQFVRSSSRSELYANFVFSSKLTSKKMKSLQKETLLTEFLRHAAIKEF
jgi:hypothetical protein